MKTISNEEKAKEIANIYRDRMLQMSQICDNDWLIIELVNDVLEWKDEQHKQERQQWIDKACERLEYYFAPDGSMVPENIRLWRDLQRVIKGE